MKVAQKKPATARELVDGMSQVMRDFQERIGNLKETADKAAGEEAEARLAMLRAVDACEAAVDAMTVANERHEEQARRLLEIARQATVEEARKCADRPMSWEKWPAKKPAAKTAAKPAPKAVALNRAKLKPKPIGATAKAVKTFIAKDRIPLKEAMGVVHASHRPAKKKPAKSAAKPAAETKSNIDSPASEHPQKRAMSYIEYLEDREQEYAQEYLGFLVHGGLPVREPGFGKPKRWEEIRKQLSKLAVRQGLAGNGAGEGAVQAAGVAS